MSSAQLDPCYKCARSLWTLASAQDDMTVNEPKMLYIPHL